MSRDQYYAMYGATADYDAYLSSRDYARSREEWNERNGVIDSYAKYAKLARVAEQKAAAEADYLRALSGYGVKGEQMAQAGIHGGYSDYLDSAAYAQMQNQKASVDRNATEGYASYADAANQRYAQEQHEARVGFNEQKANADAGYAQYAYGVEQQNKANYKAYQADEETKRVARESYINALRAIGLSDEEINAELARVDSILGSDTSVENYAGYLSSSLAKEQQKQADYKTYQEEQDRKRAYEDQYKRMLMELGMTEDEANAEVERARSVAGNLDSSAYASYLNASASIEQSKREKANADASSAAQANADAKTAADNLYASLYEEGTVFSMSDEEYENYKGSLRAILKGNGASDEVIDDVIGRIEYTRNANNETQKTATVNYMTRYTEGKIDDTEFLTSFGYTSDVIDSAVKSYMEANKVDEDEARSIVTWDYIVNAVDGAKKNGWISKEQESAFIKGRLPMYSTDAPTEEEGWQSKGETIADSVEFAFTYFNKGMLTEADKNKIINDALDMIFGDKPKTIKYDSSLDGLTITIANGLTLKADYEGNATNNAKDSLNKNFADCPIGIYDGSLYYKDEDGSWKALETKAGSKGTPGEGDNYFYVIARAMQGKKYSAHNGKDTTYQIQFPRIEDYGEPIKYEPAGTVKESSPYDYEGNNGQPSYAEYATVNDAKAKHDNALATAQSLIDKAGLLEGDKRRWGEVFKYNPELKKAIDDLIAAGGSIDELHGKKTTVKGETKPSSAITKTTPMDVQFGVR
ncbi:MAG: hypothetical protein J5958_06525 [Clostridia bacterium]|nr:hypothetical protein [Clostridia bacterium]